MLESLTTPEFQYHKLTAEEQAARGILGRLVGPIASYKKSTRNGRIYKSDVWEKTFSDPIVLEKIENRCFFGELGHPTDRAEVDMEKIAICLAEVPKKGKDGLLYGVFDILATPCGKILKTMCDYGCNIGVSSRAQGDTYEDEHGDEVVDADTYQCECWDAVILPALKEARVKLVNESLDTRKTLTKALQETIERAGEDERRVMTEALATLDMDNTPTFETSLTAAIEEMLSQAIQDALITSNTQSTVEEVLDNSSELNIVLYNVLSKLIKNPSEEVLISDDSADQVVAAEDTGADMFTELQTALSTQKELEARVSELQEQLSVCYTKETRYSTYLSTAKTDLQSAQTEIAALSQKHAALQEALEAERAQHAADVEQLKTTQAQQVKESQATIRSLEEQVARGRSQAKKLNEAVSSGTSEVKALREQVERLQSEASIHAEEHEAETSKLNEQLQEAKKDAKIAHAKTSATQTKAKELVEKYKTLAKVAVDRYIESQATIIGVTPEEIKSRLNEQYSFSDIDRVCESLQKYKLKVNSLPFNLQAGKRPVKMRVIETESVSSVGIDGDNVDDEIDSTLSQFI